MLRCADLRPRCSQIDTEHTGSCVCFPLTSKPAIARQCWVDRQFNTFERARPAETVPLARPREAVQLMADCELLATQAGWVLLEQVALRPHQAGGVIVLHLLLKRTGRRRR